MKNYVQYGDKPITVTVPNTVIQAGVTPATAGVSSGQGFLLANTVFCVAAETALAGQQVAVEVSNVFDLPKAAVAINLGDLAYWDNTNFVVTNVATSNTKIGFFTQAALQSDTTARVRLNGAF